MLGVDYQMTFWIAPIEAKPHRKAAGEGRGIAGYIDEDTGPALGSQVFVF
jgi:hypothetical protein